MRNKNAQNITGIRAIIIGYIAFIFIFYLAIREYNSLTKAIEVLRKLKKLKFEVAGKQNVNKIVKINGRYHWNMHLPGFPSKAQIANVLGEMNRISPVRSKNNRLSVLFLGITKKCPLQCLHCYEWGALNHKDTLSLSALKNIIIKFQDLGVGHIQLGGGEPMTRFDDMVEIIKDIKTHTDIWISTCGFNLSEEKAMLLKKAGLNGVAISMDHFEPELHNAFRGHQNAFDWAITATHNCQKAGLITCWSICVTREFLSKDNLIQYAWAAKKNNVIFVQLFEPMPAGRYSEKDVTLSSAQKKILEDFYFEMNTSPKYKDFPMMVYFGPRDRRIGCLGSGNRYLYIDTDGYLQSCPFCRNSKKMQVNNNRLEELLDDLIIEGCNFKNL